MSIEIKNYRLSPNTLHTIALVIVLLIGWIIRASAIFSHDLIPGINGGYYPVQARSILRTGWLAIPDFPLLFYLQALLGMFLSPAMMLENAILTSSRLIDTIFPVLSAIPIYLFSRTFHTRGSSSHSIIATLLVGLLAVGSSSMLRMAGDFQKNAFALPFFLFYTYFLYLSFKNRDRKSITLAVIFFAIVCLTHLGVAAMILLFTVCYIFIDLVIHPNRQRIIQIASTLIVILFFTLVCVSFYDPVRVRRLLEVVLNPGRLFTHSVLMLWLSGAGGEPLIEIEGLLLGNFLGILGLLTVFPSRSEMDSATKTLLLSSSLCALFLASPLIHADLSYRLTLMAYVPGLISLTYWVVRHQKGLIVGVLITILVLLHTITTLTHNQPSLTRAEYEELQSFKNDLPEGKTLVITRHGLEWWIAWTMETKITNNPQIAMRIWDNYDTVFRVAEINSNPVKDGNPPRSASRPPRRKPPPNRLPGHPPGQKPGPGKVPFFANPNQRSIETSLEYNEEADTFCVLRTGKYFKLIRFDHFPNNPSRNGEQKD